MFPSTETHLLFLLYPSFPDQLSPVFRKNLPKLLEHPNITRAVQLLYILMLSYCTSVRLTVLSYGGVADFIWVPGNMVSNHELLDC